MNCVRCGDVKQLHCRADGGNIRNAACGEYLEKWPEEPMAPGLKPAKAAKTQKGDEG